jgi:ElaB/YqjD/DUF883 family membrane-anchored ribosome-binding protein
MDKSSHKFRTIASFNQAVNIPVPQDSEMAATMEELLDDYNKRSEKRLDDYNKRTQKRLDDYEKRINQGVNIPVPQDSEMAVTIEELVDDYNKRAEKRLDDYNKRTQKRLDDYNKRTNDMLNRWTYRSHDDEELFEKRVSRSEME